MAPRVNWRSRQARALAAGIALLLTLGPLIPSADAEDSSRIPLVKGESALVHVPHIRYPERAKRLRMTGTGLVVLEVNKAGLVTAATMARSTGEEILDRAALEGLRQARFRPGTPSRVKIPVTFSLSRSGMLYDVKSKNKQRRRDR